ncbi:MAG: CCA tRNA nucleotidyltransferase [Janthinobacterium lividum]
MTAPTPRPAFFGDPALRAVLAALPRARVVGGAVRDTLAGRAVSDLDLATPDPPEAVIAALDAAGLKHAPTGLQHGTVTAISGGRGFEVTTLRRDERTDGRHAEVAWTDDWTEDAARRDFTINAMSMQPDGTVFDYFDGRADLAAGRVRFVGDPAARIAEDYLRILRFYRFHGRYARTAPDAGTARAIAEGTPGLAQLSAERVWSELKRILLLPDPAPTLRLMQQLGTLGAILPGTSSSDAVGRLVRAGAPADPVLRLAALQPGASAAGIAERFRLSRAEAAELAALDGPAPDAAWDDDALRRALADTAPATLAGRAWLQGGDAGLLARIAALPRPVFPLQGRDLLRLGLPPGPALGEHLAALRGWWLAGGCAADAAACQAELAARLALPPGTKLASAARD